MAYYFGDHSLKLQGFIGIVALQGLSGLYSDRIDTVPYILYTFDRVLLSTLKFTSHDASNRSLCIYSASHPNTPEIVPMLHKSEEQCSMQIRL